MSYSHTLVGEVGTDGVHRDHNGNVIPSGLDEDTKAELRSLLEGPRVRVLPSENDILAAAKNGKSVTASQTYINPNDSEDAAAQAFKPGYDVKAAKDDGKTAEQKDAEKAAADTDKGETVIETPSDEATQS